MADQGFMQMLKQRLMGAAKAPQPVGEPISGPPTQMMRQAIGQPKPWDVPITAGQPAPQPPMHQMPGGGMMAGAQHPDMAAIGAMPNQPSFADDPLLQALKRQQLQSAIARGTGNRRF